MFLLIIKIHIIHVNVAACAVSADGHYTFVTDHCTTLTRESLTQLQLQFTVGFQILLTAHQAFFPNNGCIYLVIPIEFHRNLN